MILALPSSRPGQWTVPRCKHTGLLYAVLPITRWRTNSSFGSDVLLGLSICGYTGLQPRPGCRVMFVHAALQTVQMTGESSAAYGTVHSKEPINHSIRLGHDPDFGFPFVAILPESAESDINQYSLTPRFRAAAVPSASAALIVHTCDALPHCRLKAAPSLTIRVK